MKKQLCKASVREVVEFALLSGSLLPGAQLLRMREGMMGHQARQKSLPDAQAEVSVRGRVEGEAITLEIGGRIDLLYNREDSLVLEEIKLAPGGGTPVTVVPVHRAQAVCYGYLLGAEQAIIRVVYVRTSGAEVAAFEEYMNGPQLQEEALGFVLPYLRMAEERHCWREARDASIHALSFPYDGFRAGQREMAVQVYWAVKSKRRLFAQAPTGTGKTAAALFPALKALGEGLTGQIFYLTARTTAQQNATAAIERMREGGLRLRALCLTAKEKICPDATENPTWRCDVLHCPYAIGFFDRLPEALAAMRLADDWSREAVAAVALAHWVCPFEFSLSLSEEADVVLCDYNYAFDPAVRLRRIFLWTTNVTLLVDEAHNLPDRGRAMLSAELSSQDLREVRRNAGKALGRKMPLYKTLTELINWLEALEPGESKELPGDIAERLSACMDGVVDALQTLYMGDLPRQLLAAINTVKRFDDRYALLVQRKGKKATSATLFCMDPAPHLRDVTQKLRGCVFFSATLTPLSAWRSAIGGVHEDGLLSLPSPFPMENLLVLRHAVSTRYRSRERTAAEVSQAILAMVRGRPGNYMACFPSYAYLRRVMEELQPHGDEVVLHVQRSRMDEVAREAYLSAFAPRSEGVLLALVVMGGVFGEGIDLPGERLSGVAIVGVSLPQVCPERELLRGYYQETLCDGFAHAYRYPGMNKVLQAVGRVIRTEMDRGIALLIDDRFLHREYAELMPSWWGNADVVHSIEDIQSRAEAFWRRDVSPKEGKH